MLATPITSTFPYRLLLLIGKGLTNTLTIKQQEYMSTQATSAEFVLSLLILQHLRAAM